MVQLHDIDTAMADEEEPISDLNREEMPDELPMAAPSSSLPPPTTARIPEA